MDHNFSSPAMTLESWQPSLVRKYAKTGSPMALTSAPDGAAANEAGNLIKTRCRPIRGFRFGVATKPTVYTVG